MRQGHGASRLSVQSDPGRDSRGRRFYLFDGGCVVYEFRVNRNETSAPLADVTLALSFLPREELRRRVLDETDGRYRLDP